MKKIMDWWLTEPKWVKPIMQKSESGEQETVTRLEIVLVFFGCIAIILLSGLAMD